MWFHEYSFSFRWAAPAQFQANNEMTGDEMLLSLCAASVVSLILKPRRKGEKKKKKKKKKTLDWRMDEIENLFQGMLYTGPC